MTAPICVLASLVTSVAITAPARQNPPIDRAATLRAARQELDAGRLESAERLYRDLLQAQPYVVEAHFGLAEAVALQGRRSEASRMLVELGKELLGAGHREAASKAFQSAIGIQPDTADAHESLGRMLLEQKSFVDAVAPLRRAVELGAALDTQLTLGVALAESGQFEEAERVYRDVVQKHPRSPVALTQLGRILAWQGQFEEAAKVFLDQVSEGEPGPDLLLDLGKALEGAGRLAEAVDAYRRAVELRPELPRARYKLAFLLARTGSPEQARREMAVFGRLHAKEQERLHEERLLEARFRQGWELLRTGESHAAVALFESLPEAPGSLQGLASALAAVGDHAGAVRALERAIALAPERTDLRMMLAAERAASEREP